MNVLDICTGIGGFSLALKWLVGGFRTVCYVEIDGYCQQVIQQRIKDGYLDAAPIWSDLKTFDGKPWRGRVDIITAGFPCQPFSVAGKQRGEKDERNLWPDLWRVCSEVRPRYIFLENVPTLIRHPYFENILRDLESINYGIEPPAILSACQTGLPHTRERMWLLAHSNGKRWDRRWSWVNETKAGKMESSGCSKTEIQWTAPPSTIQRTSDESAEELERLSALGNAIVPACAAAAFMLLSNTWKEHALHVANDSNASHGNGPNDLPQGVFAEWLARTRESLYQTLQDTGGLK